jgi:23S rRNA pseudouridine2605 synthase
MRINKFVALSLGISRRKADELILHNKIKINDKIATLGLTINENDCVYHEGQKLLLQKTQIVALNKPTGYVCSTNGQGSKTIYDLLPKNLHHLKPIGRLDKDSSGLLILTNDGLLAYELSHPKFQKNKIYQVQIDKPLNNQDKIHLNKGVLLSDGVSKFKLSGSNKNWQVTISEGKNRQIRRTFSKLGYKAIKLNRTQFGPYTLNDIEVGKYQSI